MKPIKQILTLVALVLFAIRADASTYYSKVTVATQSGEGKVYVSKNNTTPSADAYQLSAELTQQSQAKNPPTHTYYLYAQAPEGKVFSKWLNGSATVSLENPAEVSVTASSTTESSPSTVNYVARFIDPPAVTVTTETASTKVAIVPDDNKIGDEVTLTATVQKIPTYGCKNVMIHFEGWEDENGELLSTESSYKFTIEKPMAVKARFRNDKSIKAAGYYRVRNIFNRVLAIDGNWNYQDFKSKGNYLDGLVRWACPDDFNVADFQGKVYLTDDNPRLDIESLVSAVMYFEGESPNPDAGPNEKALDKVNVYGQGTDITTLTGYELTLKPCASTMEGYMILYGPSSGGFKLSNRTEKDAEGNTLGLSCVGLLGDCKYDDTWSAMAVQPIDEEHFDRYWFGASASKEMEFDGGYWTTMYTGFPYECRDGVEAYYPTGVQSVGGEDFLVLKQIEDGIVAAETPVMLKCRGERSRENRLMPLDFHGTYPKPEGNMLVGLYQLYTDKELNGKVGFDGAAMRVLGINNGQVGFYKMADGTILEPNKCYLDITRLGSNPAQLGLMIGSESGITTVTEDSLASGAAVYYDLTGIRVEHPQAGQVYIVRRGSSVTKVRY